MVETGSGGYELTDTTVTSATPRTLKQSEAISTILADWVYSALRSVAQIEDNILEATGTPYTTYG
jgi:hypothetical protein